MFSTDNTDSNTMKHNELNKLLLREDYSPYLVNAIDSAYTVFPNTLLHNLSNAYFLCIYPRRTQMLKEIQQETQLW